MPNDERLGDSPHVNQKSSAKPSRGKHRERFLIEQIAKDVAAGRRPPPDSAEVAQYEDALPEVGVLTIGQAAALIGLETSTLRYYEDQGLLNVKRLSNGHRVFDSASLGQLITVHRLRLSGMPVKEISELTGFIEDGHPDARAEAVALLKEHAHAVRVRVAELQIALAITEHKLELLGADGTGQPGHGLAGQGVEAQGCNVEKIKPTKEKNHEHDR